MKRLLSAWRRKRAQAKLARLVSETREAYETKRFVERRKAALKHHRPELAQ